MSQQDPNSSNSEPPVNDPKNDESAESLAKRLQEKFGINTADLRTKAEANMASKELGHTIQQEVADKEFIDLEEYTKTRSRHIERRYGLKPMNELISPKTEEDRKKELESYLKRNSLAARTSKGITNMKNTINNELREAEQIENSYPAIYQWFENVPGYRPEVNIGEKWADQITKQIKNETDLSRSLRKGGYIQQSWKTGKMGIDKYLILFGVFGAVMMPAYIYYRNKKYKEFIMAERGLTPGEDIDFETHKFDIDDMSQHRRFFDDREERKKAIERLSRKKEIRKLEEELYPNGAGYRG